MKCSCGSSARKALRMLKPPIPLSNTPMARVFKSSLARARSSDAGERNALELTGGNLLLPFGRPGDMHTGAARIDCDSDRHIDHVKFVNRFHTQVGKTHDSGCLDGFGNQVSRTAHRHQVSAL